MRLRFIDREGTEQVIDGRSAWIAAVRQGALTPDTAVFDVHERRWVKASEIGGFPAPVLGAR